MSKNIASLKGRLAGRAADFCAHLFPEGRLRYGKFYVGDLLGNPGRSLVVTVDGDNVGLWKDFATGVGGSNLLELLHQKNGGQDFAGAMKEAGEWLESAGVGIGHPGSSGRPLPSAGSRGARKQVDRRDLGRGTRQDMRRLAERLGVAEEALEKATNDGVLYFFDHPANGRCWSVVDATFIRDHSDRYASGNLSYRGPSHVRQDRRLDGKPFVFADGSTGKGRTVGSASQPVGKFPLKGSVVLCEGSSDFLAAHHLIWLEQADHPPFPELDVSAVAMLGASARIHGDCLPEFSGRAVLVFPDYDSAGVSGASQWEKQLSGTVPSFTVFDYANLCREDGRPVNDLRDFLQVSYDEWEMNCEVRSPIAHFINKTRKASNEITF